jgi:nickel-dependent lactate racemase
LWQEELPELTDACWLEASGSLEPLADLAGAVDSALESPIGCGRLRDRLGPDDTVSIVVCDATRRSPTRTFLDGLSRELDRAGVPPRQVTVVVATGTHRASSEAELHAMLGEDHLGRYPVVVHDCHDTEALAYLGETSRGLPVWLNRAVVESSVKVLTGAIIPHHLTGFAGGRKSVLPGVAGAETVSRHHSFPIRTYEPALGKMDGNPAHEEAVEAARMLGVDLVLNAVPNPQGKGFVGVVAGELEAAHEAGVAICSQTCHVAFPQRFEVTICSAGGYPKDMNLHQAQKALTVAEMMTKPGGTIVLVAECGEGLGSGFARWLQESTPQEVLVRFREDGWSNASGKAMMFARALCGFQVLAVSSLDRKTLSSIHLRKAESVSDAWQVVRSDMGATPTTAILPRASGLIPVEGVAL